MEESAQKTGLYAAIGGVVGGVVGPVVSAVPLLMTAGVMGGFASDNGKVNPIKAMAWFVLAGACAMAKTGAYLGSATAVAKHAFSEIPSDFNEKEFITGVDVNAEDQSLNQTDKDHISTLKERNNWLKGDREKAWNICYNKVGSVIESKPKRFAKAAAVALGLSGLVAIGTRIFLNYTCPF